MADRSTRHTPQRQCIIDILARHRGALSAEEILRMARESFPRMALTTVYRNLESLAAAGTVHGDRFSDGVMHYHLSQPTHGHALICLGCRKSIPLPACPLHALEQELMRDTGFTIEDHRLEIYGYCAECRHARADRPEGEPPC